jgi:hypothetical protein
MASSSRIPANRPAAIEKGARIMAFVNAGDAGNTPRRISRAGGLPSMTAQSGR